MLVNLEINNLAVIEQAELQLRPGLNVLTGETGAGKSILLDAIGLTLGARASADLVRSEARQARVDGLFALDEGQGVYRLLEEQQLQEETEGQLLLSREISAQGRSVARVNSRLAPVGLLRDLGRWLVDMHGQGQHQSLLQPATQMNLLDSYAGAEAGGVAREVSSGHRRIQELREHLDNLESQERERLRLQEVYRHQVEEIDGAGVIAGEEVELQREQKILQHKEQLFSLVNDTYQRLYAGEYSALDQVGTSRGDLQQAAHMDQRLEGLLEELEGVVAALEEVGRLLADYRYQLELNPDRLEQLEERLQLLQDLRRKYGRDMEQVLAYREWAAGELEKLQHQDMERDQLQEELNRSEEQLREQARELSRQRREAGCRLEEAVARELHELNMGEMRLGVSFHPHEAGLELPGAGGEPLYCRRGGLEEVVLVLAANPGEEERPLARVASGGELSRVMLALKTVLDQADPVPTLVFDEIDAGVGGKAAQAVAERMACLGGSRQVLCVTHLPQLASMADAHFRIDKEVREGRTYTRVEELDQEGRVQELARMLGGARVTTAVEGHAREMLRLATQTRNKLRQQRSGDRQG